MNFTKADPLIVLILDNIWGLGSCQILSVNARPESLPSLPSCWEVKLVAEGWGGWGPGDRAVGPSKVYLARSWGQGLGEPRQ